MRAPLIQKMWKGLQLAHRNMACPAHGRCRLSTQSALVERPLKDFSVVKLNHKSLVKLSGADVYPFLQGIITNDMQCLEHDCSSLYSQLLNIKGRVVCDLMLYKDTQETGDVLIEVDNAQTDLFMKTLKKYKIRKKVKIEDQTASLSSFAAFGCINEKPTTDQTSAVIYKDPRLQHLGWRIISSLDMDNVRDEDLYRMHRYKLGVGEGPQEHLPEKALPLECNSALLYGVSFNKGCFMGQELTSRSHHTGVIRKRIMPITYDKQSSLEANSDVKLHSTNKTVGVIRGAVNGYGVALLRVNDVLKQDTALYTTDSSGDRVNVFTHRPSWWPDGVVLV